MEKERQLMIGLGELIVCVIILQLLGGFVSYRLGLRVGRAEGQLQARAQR